MRATEFLTETITPTDLTHLRYYLIDLFEPFGLDFKFSSHFLDRANDLRNKKPITPGELTRLFRKVLKQHGRSIIGLAPNIEVVLKDLATKINVPVAILPPETADDARTIVAKTVMRKPEFLTTNPVFAIEGAEPTSRVFYTAYSSRNLALTNTVAESSATIAGNVATVSFGMGVQRRSETSTQLLPYIINDLKRHGVKYVNVITKETSAKSRRILESAGFKETQAGADGAGYWRKAT